MAGEVNEILAGVVCELSLEQPDISIVATRMVKTNCVFMGLPLLSCHPVANPHDFIAYTIQSLPYIPVLEAEQGISPRLKPFTASNIIPSALFFRIDPGRDHFMKD